MANYYSVNKVILVGNIVRDPELRYTAQQRAVANFSIATNQRWKTKDGETRDEAEFHNLVAWGKIAEICKQILSPGAKIYVSGRLQTRDWTGDDGVKRYKTEIIVDEMVLLSSKAETDRMAMKSGGGGDQGNQGDQPRTTSGAGSGNTEETEGTEGTEKAEEEEDGGKSASAPGGASAGKEKVNPDDIPF